MSLNTLTLVKRRVARGILFGPPPMDSFSGEQLKSYADRSGNGARVVDRSTHMVCTRKAGRSASARYRTSNVPAKSRDAAQDGVRSDGGKNMAITRQRVLEAVL
jgi:hypothetical protein